jgi:hypothetical protein
MVPYRFIDWHGRYSFKEMAEEALTMVNTDGTVQQLASPNGRAGWWVAEKRRKRCTRSLFGRRFVVLMLRSNERVVCKYIIVLVSTLHKLPYVN